MQRGTCITLSMTWTNPPELDPHKAFNSARHQAKTRGITWNLTFDEWWQLWRDHWHRKLTERLCLARYADWGPYERNNCRVITIAENTDEGRRMTKIVTTICNDIIDLLA